jgi:hypothetical protein
MRWDFASVNDVLYLLHHFLPLLFGYPFLLKGAPSVKALEKTMMLAAH